MSGLGRPLCGDECNTNANMIFFARILVDMYVTKPLPNLLNVSKPMGKLEDQIVTYDWRPICCPTCFQVGHSCPKKSEVERQLSRTKFLQVVMAPMFPTNR